MIPYPLKSALTRVFHTAAVIRYANRHYAEFAMDTYDRQSIARMKRMTDGMTTVPSIMILLSPLPFDSEVKNLMVQSGQLFLTVGMLYAGVLARDLYCHGMAELARLEKIHLLSSGQPRGP